MVGEVFGGDGVLVLVVGVALLAIPLWALVDALSRPGGAFRAAGSSKGMWIALILVFWLLTGGVLGLVMAVVYLAAIRPRVRAVMPGS
jgi:hypothetical protein